MAIASWWADVTTFWAGSREHFKTTGSILPSSRFLANELARPLNSPRPPLRILEVGPGTGPVTRSLLQRLIPGDTLDLVELNPMYTERLKQHLANDPLFMRHASQIRIIPAAIESVPGESLYDVIVSGLPLNGFPPGLVRRIYHALRRLISPGGTLTYFEYAWIRPIQKLAANAEERKRIAKVARIVERYIRKFQCGKTLVPANVPPAYVRRLKLKPASSEIDKHRRP